MKLFLAVLCLNCCIAHEPPTHPPATAVAHRVASGILHCLSSGSMKELEKAYKLLIWA